MAEAYRCIARVQKTHGRKGEVVVVPTNGLPFLLSEGLCVVAVPPALKGPRRLTVRSCSASGNGQLVSFSGVASLGVASKLVGKSLLVKVSDLPTDFALKDVESLMGREVEDERWGALGVIDEIMRGPANDVWVVQGPYGEVLVPAVEPVVRSWDGQGPIVVSTPNGLVRGAGASEDEVGESICD